MASQQEEILATEEWVAELTALPFFSKVRLTLHLTLIFVLEKREDRPPPQNRVQVGEGWCQKNEI